MISEDRLSSIEAMLGRGEPINDLCAADLVAEIRRLKALASRHPMGEGHTCEPVMVDPMRGYAYAVDCGCRL